MCFLMLCNGARGLSLRKLEAIWRFPRNQLPSFHRIIWMCSRPFVTIIALLPLDNHWEPLPSDCSAWARVNQHPCWYLHLNSETLKFQSKHWIFVQFRNNLSRFWDFYHGTNAGADVLTRPRYRAPSAEYNVSFCCETVTYCMVKVNVTIPEIREREWVQLGTDKAFM